MVAKTITTLSADNLWQRLFLYVPHYRRRNLKWRKMIFEMKRPKSNDAHWETSALLENFSNLRLVLSVSSDLFLSWKLKLGSVNAVNGNIIDFFGKHLPLVNIWPIFNTVRKKCFIVFCLLKTTCKFNCLLACYCRCWLRVSCMTV